ncbi:MAG: M12 family metallo-peptidase [Phycisphaerales bacterium]
MQNRTTRALSIGLSMGLAWLAGASALSAQVATGVTGVATEPDQVWAQLGAFPPAVEAGRPFIRPLQYQRVALAEGLMHDTLWTAPREATPAANQPLILWLPKPDGTFERFSVVESPIMTPDFQAVRPDVRTFVGQGMDDPAATLRCDWTTLGFRAQVLSPGGAWYIDPYTFFNTTYYVSYFKRDFWKDTSDWHCETTGEPIPQAEPVFGDRVVTTLRTYRLALAATGEYTAFFGGTVANAQSAMITSVNRVTGVYEKEVGIRLSLINNTSIIYTNSGTDPYTNNNGSTMLGQNQTNLTTVIGSANYDIGHVFSTGGGGVAGLGVVCNTSNKARGVTGSSAPTGDAYDIDYVAHEMGHQFNAPHTFAGTTGSCAGNGTSSAAYEPGSGSTIMGYAGICGADDLQPHSDPYFHHASIDTINAFKVGSGACSVNTSTTNNPPTVAGAAARSIPKQTAFYLTGSGSDPDGNALTFEWEEHDAGNLRTLATGDNGSGPLFRPRVPTSSPTQYFPALDDVFDGTLDAGDIWPVSGRTLNFRLTARDNVAGGGGTTNTTSNSTVTIVAAAGPFQVTAPNTAVSLTGGGSTTVTWNVASTTAAPISAASVSIALTTDAGANWTTLLASTPNDGSEAVTLPNISTTTARIKVEAVGNSFFDVSNTNFTITGVTAPPTPINVSASPNPACTGQPTSLSAIIAVGSVGDWYTGSCNGTFVGTGNPLVVTPAGTTTYFVRARRTSDGALSSACGSVTVTMNATPSAPTGASSDRTGFCADDAGTISLTATGGSGSNLRWYTGSCGGTFVGTGTPLVIASPAATTTYYARWENNCASSDCVTTTVEVAPAAASPSSAAVDRGEFCSTDAGTITLTATGGSGTTLAWYADACAGTPVGTGSPLVIDSPAVSTTYFARWETACAASGCVSVGVNATIASTDFNNDGLFPDTADLDDMLSVFSGGSCSNDPNCGSIDFNGDGLFPDTADIDAFLLVFSGGSC